MSVSTAAPAAAAAAAAAEDGASVSSDINSKPHLTRRTVVTVESRLSADGGGKATIDGKERSHTIGVGSVAQTARCQSKLRKGLIAPPATYPPRKKAVPKHEKPRWQTISALTKNLLLLVFLLWLAQKAWRWTHIEKEDADSLLAALEYGTKLSEVEASVERTSKMLQVQLDALDKKISSEIATVTRALLKQAEEKGTLFEEELKKLEVVTVSLDESLGELTNMGLLTREDFEKLLNELKNSKIVDDGNRKPDMEQIRLIARDIVKKEIETHAAGGLGMLDYALASGGAKVVRHSEPYDLRKANSWFTFANGRNGVHANACKMLEPSFGEPGQCFPLLGSTGFVEIRLRKAIIVTAVTLEHVSKSVAYDRSSAPKECRMTAWFDSHTVDPSSNMEKIKLLTEFLYDLAKSNAQTFNVDAGDSDVVNMIRLDFRSNHGNPVLTCIYRLRVHGYEPSLPATLVL